MYGWFAGSKLSYLILEEMHGQFDGSYCANSFWKKCMGGSSGLFVPVILEEMYEMSIHQSVPYSGHVMSLNQWDKTT